MLHVGLDLSRKKLDVCVLSDEGEVVDEFAVPPDADGLRAPGPGAEGGDRCPVWGSPSGTPGGRAAVCPCRTTSW
jgi:hypothetical protein